MSDDPGPDKLLIEILEALPFLHPNRPRCINRRQQAIAAHTNGGVTNQAQAEFLLGLLKANGYKTGDLVVKKLRQRIRDFQEENRQKKKDRATNLHDRPSRWYL
ncbi:hypothetical protein ACFL04_03185 [Patescibacteria group bacterium]